MNDTQIQEILKEVRGEQHISPLEKDEIIIGYIKEAEFDINDKSGEKINYEVDLKARGLLKNYVLYSRYKKLAEFKELYGGDYIELQTKYYNPANIQ